MLDDSSLLTTVMFWSILAGGALIALSVAADNVKRFWKWWLSL